jgi:tetratricopeptide (TPR) repeat protein
MLSTPYLEIRRLRSIGDCAGAVSMLSRQPPACDEDAFEAAVCLLICGQPENAVHVARTYRWQKHWARRIAQALIEMVLGGDDERALSLARAAIADPAAPCDASALYLLLLQKNALFDEAGEYVGGRWRDPPSGETFLLTMLAEIAAATKRWRDVNRYAYAVLASDPDDLRALIALSVSDYEQGNFHAALGNARRAHSLNPGSARAILQMMRCQNKLGDHYAALAAFDALNRDATVTAEHHVELGRAYAGLEHREQAIAAYQAALVSDANSMEAIRSLVAMYAIAGESAALESVTAQYAAQIGTDVDSMYWRGLESLNHGDLDAAAQLFASSLAVSDAQRGAFDLLPWPVPEPRLRHDYEQLDLLQRREKLDTEGRAALKVLAPYYSQSGDATTTFAPEGAEGQALKRVLATRYNLPAQPFDQLALGENDYTAIEDRYFSERLVVVDNFLSPAALRDLRSFCEEATVWKSYHRHGYVGAIIALGFSPKVLLALSEELRRAMPRVIGDEPLLQAWAFKYDQRLQGINMHADFAKVNVNFWITPDTACEDPASGGMIVYDLPVPKSWTVADYNSDPRRLAAYVKLRNAKPVRVPYRENRCVVFDSSLIHVTDEMHFKPGYENRRVNLTLLYGRGLNVSV